jgi:hypothetical protein
VSLLVLSIGIAGGVLLARAVGRTLRRGGEEVAKTPDDRKAPPTGEARNEVPPPDETNANLAKFPCQLGDVLIKSTGEEAWLAGALVFCERLPMAILFVAPDAGGDGAVFARQEPQRLLLWLRPVAPESLPLGREPPTSVEHERERFERIRRIPYRVERAGTGAPDLGPEAIVAEYKSAQGDFLVVVMCAKENRIWRGRSLDDGTYDRLPGSQASTAEGFT